jgi:hypothetical protein
MAIKVLTPDDWTITAPVVAGRHAGMTISAENPFFRLLEIEPHSYMAPHSHSEPEIIVVLEGRMFFNGVWCPQGSVVFAPANEDYWHSTGHERCVVGLIRPRTSGRISYADERVPG